MSIYASPTYVYWIHLPEHTNMFEQGYIGVSINPKHRLWEHHNDVKKNTHCNPHLSRSIQKYSDQIIQTIILKGTNDYCYQVEELLRPTKHIGWNINKGGDCPPSGKGIPKPSVSLALKGRPSPKKGKPSKNKGKPSPRKGVPNPNVTKALTGVPRPDLKGKVLPPRSEEWCNNLRKPKTKLTCPHCNKSGGAPQMKRYHFDNCKAQ